MHNFSYCNDIAHGAFSKCKLYLKDDKKYAIKIPIDNYFCNIYNELREIAILKTLSHENIININDIIINLNGKINLVYDYYEEDLGKFIKQNTNETRLSLVNKFLQQLLSAVHYIHSKNIIHTDLKDSNILIDKTKGFKILIIDFGSSLINKLTSKCSLVSTYTVRAPEIYKYDFNYNEKIDIWSMGVLLFSFLTGYELLDTYVHEKTDDTHKIDDINLFVANIDKLKIKDNYKNLLKHMLDIDQNTRYNISEVIILFQSISNLEVDIRPYEECKNYANYNVNNDLLSLNNYLKARIYDDIDFNLYIGSNILSKLSKYNNLDVICIWYLNYLLVNNYKIHEISYFNIYFNNFYGYSYSKDQIKRNCLEILKKIDFKLV